MPCPCPTDKVTGASLKGPYLSNVLQQPFYSTEDITKLVRIAEELVRKLAVREGEGLTQNYFDCNPAPKVMHQLRSACRSELANGGH